MKKEVILVTGASSGIGFATALALKEKGYIVYGAARRMDKLADLEKKGVNIIPLDVTNDDSMVSCVNTIIEKEGKIDVLVNNAGLGLYGAVEEVSIEEAKKQMEVNVFGLARMTQLVLPHMRKKHSGKIINLSSAAGRMHTPLGAWYHTSKFAVEGLSDCLRVEVAQFGIDVVIIEPGAIKTQWNNNAGKSIMKASGNGPYKDLAHKLYRTRERTHSAGKGSEPSLVANTIVEAVESKKPKTRYAVGSNAKSSILVRKIAGDRMYDKILFSTLNR